MTLTLTGANTFLIQSELRKIVTKFVEQHGDMALEKIQADVVDFDRLRESLQNLPFLAARKLVVLYQPGLHRQFAENLGELLKTIPETVDVIIIEPMPDRRTSYYKSLKSQTEFREFGELDARGLVSWLTQSAAEKGGKLSLGDANYLVDRLGTNQLLLSNELDKLLQYQPEITRSTIDLLTDPTPQTTIFELLDAAFSGDSQKALAIYADQRRQQVEPQAILPMIAWQLHAIALVKAAGERSNAEIAQEAGINPFVVRKSRALAKNLTIEDIKSLVSAVLKLDIDLKSKPIDADEALQHLFLQISQTDIAK